MDCALEKVAPAHRASNLEGIFHGAGAADDLSPEQKAMMSEMMRIDGSGG
jgi:hypothetical protein